MWDCGGPMQEVANHSIGLRPQNSNRVDWRYYLCSIAYFQREHWRALGCASRASIVDCFPGTTLSRLIGLWTVNNSCSGMSFGSRSQTPVEVFQCECSLMRRSCCSCSDSFSTHANEVCSFSHTTPCLRNNGVFPRTLFRLMQRTGCESAASTALR